MRTPKQAYDEALAVITQRIQAPNVVTEKAGYKLGLQVAIEQLRTSFYGVFPKDVAATQEPEKTRMSMESGSSPGKSDPDSARMSMDEPKWLPTKEELDEHTYQFCGCPSCVDPADQCAPADCCTEADHNPDA